jgi:hypothetical protein
LTISRTVNVNSMADMEKEDDIVHVTVFRLYVGQGN